MAAQMSASGNPRDGIGANNPPEPIDALPALQTDIADLVAEADGITAVENEAQAEQVKDLLARAKASQKAVKAALDAETAPLLKAEKETRARFKPVQTAVSAVVDAVAGKLTPWNVEQDRIRREAAEAIRKQAEADMKAAQEALRSDDLQANIDAELAIEQAAKAKAAANKLDRVATGLRTFWDAEMIDPLAFGKWAWTHLNAEYAAFLTDLAQREIRVLKHDLPGVKAIERKELR